MPRPRKAFIVLIGTVMAAAILACSSIASAIPDIPGIPNWSGTATQDAIVNAATPASPLSGDWGAAFDGGKIVFHISRDGSRIYAADVQLSGWHCGGTIMSTTMQVSSPDWTIERHQFSITIDLNPPHIEELSFDGTYDEASQTWSGTWDGDEYGQHCGGDWQATK